MGVVIEASSERHGPAVRDCEPLLSEIRMVVDAEALERIGLAVVCVSGTQDLMVEPRDVHLVAQRWSTKGRLEPAWEVTDTERGGRQELPSREG